MSLGAYPPAPLFQGSNGVLYGTTGGDGGLVPRLFMRDLVDLGLQRLGPGAAHQRMPVAVSAQPHKSACRSDI